MNEIIVGVGSGIDAADAWNEVEAYIHKTYPDIIIVGFLGRSRPISASVSVEVLQNTAQDADAVWSATSSDPKQALAEVFTVSTAGNENPPVPVFLYAVSSLELFVSVLRYVNGVFFVNGEEAENAKRAGVFPSHTRFITSGDPKQESLFDIRFAKETVRRKLGIPQDATVILCPGTETLAVNVALFAAALDAAKTIESEDDKRKCFIVASLPLWDLNDRKHYEEIAALGKTPFRIVGKSEMDINDIVPCADVLFDASSSAGIRAACLRKPIVALTNELTLGFMERGTRRRSWELIKKGCSVNATNGHEAGRAIAQLLNFTIVYDEMKMRQEQAFPRPPEIGEAARIMGDTLVAAAREHAAQKRVS